MSMGDGGNILVGQVVAERLSQRDTYQGKLRALKFTVKHGVELRVCQLVDVAVPYLNSQEPAPAKRGRDGADPEVPGRLHGAALQAQPLRAEPPGAAPGRRDGRHVLDDGERPRRAAREAGQGPRAPRSRGASKDDLPSLLEYYQEIDVWVLEALTRFFVASQVGGDYREYFEGKEKCLLVSEEGRRVLVRDWPQVARAMGLVD